MSSSTAIPPFKLVAQPLNNEAAKLSKFKWAAPEVGQRHQLGGKPTFLQEEKKPICSSCNNPMVFYAQLDSVNYDFVLADC